MKQPLLKSSWIPKPGANAVWAQALSVLVMVHVFLLQGLIYIYIYWVAICFVGVTCPPPTLVMIDCLPFLGLRHLHWVLAKPMVCNKGTSSKLQHMRRSAVSHDAGAVTGMTTVQNITTAIRPPVSWFLWKQAFRYHPVGPAVTKTPAIADHWRLGNY